jgi:hypothetical protein
MNSENLLARAHRALTLLETRKKAVVKEHSERMKRIEGACDAIVNHSLEPGLLDVDLTLDPDVLELIDNPDAGL